MSNNILIQKEVGITYTFVPFFISYSRWKLKPKQMVSNIITIVYDFYIKRYWTIWKISLFLISLHLINWKDLYKILSFCSDVWYLLKVIMWRRFGLKTEASTLSKVTLSIVIITLGLVNTIRWMDNTGISSTILKRTNEILVEIG